MNKIFYLFLEIVVLGLLLISSCGEGNINGQEKELEEDPINGFFSDEVLPPNTMECFSGAYYRKVVSSHDDWVGIEGTVTLPEIEFDEERINPEKSAQYLDNPSIYLGGNSNEQETDIGLTWEVIREEDGSVSAERKAFRPFFRRAGYEPTGQQSEWISAPAQKEYYWYPADEITISLQLIGRGKLQFTIEGEGKSFQETYKSDGYMFGSASNYKRVNAIDQVGNEGEKVHETNTRVANSRWSSTSLFRNTDSTIVKVPMHEGRSAEMKCPDAKFFNITASEEDLKIGAETITIDGRNE